MKRGEGRFDRSFADLMAGVAVVFLLLAIIFMRQAAREREQAERERDAQKQKVDAVAQRRQEVETALASLREALANVARDDGSSVIRVVEENGNPNVVEIEFTELTFGLGQCRPPSSYVSRVRASTVPLVSSICSTIRHFDELGARATITLEGHTDQRRFAARSVECGVLNPSEELRFENNVRASAARAQEVFFILRDELKKQQKLDELTCLDRNFVVSGRGEAAPLAGIDPNDARQRRLIIRVQAEPGGGP